MPALQVVVFKLRDELYALPVGDVREVVRLQEITPLPKAPAFLLGVISLRGRIVPVMDLRKQFDRPADQPTERVRILITRLPSSMSTRSWVGLIVDGVEEVASIPPEAVEPAPEFLANQLGQDYLAGIARRGTKLVVLLNTAGILSPDQIQQLEQNLWQKSSS